MKNIHILILLFCSFLAKAQNEYWAETAAIDSFLLIQEDATGTVIAQQKIISDAIDNTRFTFKSKDAEHSYIQLFCNDCDGAIPFSLSNVSIHAHTDTIQLHKDHKIAIAACFEDHPYPSQFEQFVEDPMGYIKTFLGFTRKKLPRRRSPILRGPERPSPDEPKLYFDYVPHAYYSDSTAVEVPFKVFEGHPIKSIYIISHDGDLVFVGGDTQLVGEVFDVTNKVIPAIPSILPAAISKTNGYESYQLTWQNLQPHLWTDIELGKWYQIGIQLENDDSDFNPYLFNFQILTKEELLRLEQLIPRNRSNKNRK